MFGKISVCSMAILLPISGILGQSTFGSVVSAVKDPGERNNHRAQITLTDPDDCAQRTASADSNDESPWNLRYATSSVCRHATEKTRLES